MFWKRFMKEWIPTRIPRKKWKISFPDIKIGDIVLVVDPDTERGK